MEVRRADGLLVEVVRPLFTGYVFVQFDPQTDPWKQVCYTYGIRGLLGYQTERDLPTPVPLIEMDALFARLAEHGGVVTLTASRPKYIEPGTLLRVLLGPYRDRNAIAEADRGARIDVLLWFAGAQRRTRLPRDCVEVAGEVLREGRRAVATPGPAMHSKRIREG